jgi:hypothetical protein
MRKKYLKCLFCFTLALGLVLPSAGVIAKTQDDTGKTKHSASAKKKKGKTKNKGMTIKVEKDPQTGPMEDVSNMTEVSQDPSQAGDKGKSKKSKN